MKIQRIKIEGLFDQFDYDIELDNPEHLRIITGPNGFGKTMILNLLNGVLNNDLDFLVGVPFKKIEIFFERDYRLEIDFISAERPGVLFGLTLYSGEKFWIGATFALMTDFLPVSKPKLIHQGNRFGKEAETYLTSNKEKLRLLPEGPIPPALLIHLVDARLYYVREQRAIQIDEVDLNIKGQSIRVPEVTPRILKLSEELRQILKEAQNVSWKISNHLDATFLKRVLEEKAGEPFEAIEARYALLKAQTEELNAYGLQIKQLEIPAIEEKNANLLRVFSEDSEQRLAPFTHLLEKLNLFIEILNKRRLYHKQIKIHADRGFEFLTDSGKPIPPNSLSSGEQNEIIMWYEIILKADENTTLLIDEPEKSLHVAWQREYLNDLMKIIKLKNCQAIVATHSPSIINDRWDLVTDLYELSNP